MPTTLTAAAPPVRIRRSERGVVPAVLLTVLLLSGCVRAASPPAAVVAPAPAPAPETLDETSDLLEMAVAEPVRDFRGDVAYDLPVEANSWVEAELEFLISERREVIGRWLERGDAYEAFIKRILAEEQVPTDLYHVAMIESGFLPTARSRAGAVGLWQFMPATARGMGLRVDAEVDERMDPVRSTRAAARHLRWLHGVYGDWALAAAAYNAGSGRISRAMQKFGASNFWDLAQRGDLAAETRHYVPRLYAVTVIARGRERFGFQSPQRPAEFSYDSIQVEIATPLQELAKLGEPAAEELAKLNPHLINGATPDGGYWVWVPAGTGVTLQRAWLASDFRKSGGMGTYVVRAGDNLSRLAQLAGMTGKQIRELNPKVNFQVLQIGEQLRLPRQVAQQLTDRPSSNADPRTVLAGSGGELPANAHSQQTHTVADGETLWGIARSHQVSVSAIQEMNGLAGTTIRPGQSLRIPVSRVAPETAASADVIAAEAVEHIVRSGDSLWSIARTYGTTVDAIQSANGLGDRPIMPGQRLEIPR